MIKTAWKLAPMIMILSLAFLLFGCGADVDEKSDTKEYENYGIQWAVDPSWSETTSTDDGFAMYDYTISDNSKLYVVLQAETSDDADAFIAEYRALMSAYSDIEDFTVSEPDMETIGELDYEVYTFDFVNEETKDVAFFKGAFVQGIDAGAFFYQVVTADANSTPDFSELYGVLETVKLD